MYNKITHLHFKKKKKLTGLKELKCYFDLCIQFLAEFMGSVYHYIYSIFLLSLSFRKEDYPG